MVMLPIETELGCEQARQPDYFALDATIASGRYMSRLVP
jgi:hypothetical protein